MLAGLNLKIIGLLVVFAAILGAGWYIKRLQSQVEGLTTEKIVLENSIKIQNAAIDQLKVDSDARLAQAEIALKAAQDAVEKAKGRARIIYKTKPSTPGNDCKSALDLINEGVK